MMKVLQSILGLINPDPYILAKCWPSYMRSLGKSSVCAMGRTSPKGVDHATATGGWSSTAAIVMISCVG